MTTIPSEPKKEEGIGTAHTPGPWFIGTAYTDDEGYVELPIQALVNGKVASPAAVCLQFPRVPGMQDANAHLISAAPELLKALQKLMCGDVEDAMEAVQQARAAIAKATGGKP